jgi:GNAT superfamily N-acetyltransferase
LARVWGKDHANLGGTVIWLDKATRTAEFEPVGTHQRYRRRGLALALLHHGMVQARNAGARQMLVACLRSASTCSSVTSGRKIHSRIVWLTSSRHCRPGFLTCAVRR